MISQLRTMGFYKFDLQQIPDDFLSNPSVLESINDLVARHEQDTLNIESIDFIYRQWCDLLKCEMYEHTPHKRINFSNSLRKHRRGKPCRNGKLSEMWNE